MTTIIARQETKKDLTPVVKKLVDKVGKVTIENVPDDKKVYWVDVKRAYPEISEKIKFLFKGKDSISIGDLKKELVHQKDELLWLSEDIWDDNLQAELYDICKETQKVLQLNIGTELIGKIKKDPILDDFFSEFSRLMGGSMHPAHTQTLAWIRYYKFPTFWVVEEIQSDLFGKSTKLADLASSRVDAIAEKFSEENKKHLEDFWVENFKDWDMKLMSSLISMARREDIDTIWIFDEDVKEETGLSMSKKNRFYKEVPRNLGFKRDVLKIEGKEFTAWKRAIASSNILIAALNKIIATNVDSIAALLQKVPTLPFSIVTAKIWRCIQDEGLDEEFGVTRQDWSWAKLPISDDMSRGLKLFDDQVVEAFNEFDIALKNKYGKKYTDLIDYASGEVVIVRVDADISLDYLTK